MLAIFKKEMKSYLTSMIGYVFVAGVLVMTGIFFVAYNLTYAYPLFAYTLSRITFLFLVITPMLTMRIISEETRQKTDQLLYTAPVSIGKIIAGKFLAVLVMFLIPIAIIGLYPLIMSQYGSIGYLSTYVAFLGFILLGAANIAIGLFLSSLTESPIISAVVTFGVLYVSNYLVSGINSLIPETAAASLFIITLLILLAGFIIHRLLKNTVLTAAFVVIAEAALAVVYFLKSSLLEGAIQNILSIFDLDSHFSVFMEDILDLQGIVYFISIILFFLYLTVQTIQKRRWS